MDSGWNDPPKVETTAAGPLKINLNKRIAFPMQQQTSSTQIATKTDLISCATPPKSLIANQEVKKDEILENDNCDMSTEKTRIIESLRNNVINLELSKQNDVLKRLQLLENDWNDIDTAALQLLIQLEKSLTARNSTDAAAIHRKMVLMGNSKYNGWLQALRVFVINITLLSESPETDE